MLINSELVIPAVKLRDHPLITYHGRRNWPPLWTRNPPPDEAPIGDAGILKHLVQHEHLPRRSFLMIEHDGKFYTGCLLFDDAAFCKQIAEFLQF